MKFSKMRSDVEAPKRQESGGSVIRAYLPPDRGLLQVFDPNNNIKQFQVRLDTSTGKVGFNLPPSFRVVVPTGIILANEPGKIVTLYASPNIATTRGIHLASGVEVLTPDGKKELTVCLVNSSDRIFRIEHQDIIALLTVTNLSEEEFVEQENEQCASDRAS